MDMQNVSNLQIPEGAVRTIHDKDDKLLWGRLAYDTKYAGDTLQQAYSGKNLWNPDVYYSNNDVYTPSVGITIPNTLNPNVTSSFTDSQITVISTIKNGGGMYLSPALSPGTYHISVNVTPSGGSGGRIRANILDSSHTVLRNDDYWSIGAGTTRQIDFNVTVASGEVYIAISLIATGDNGGTVTANNPQLELGSSATTYQKFVGGTPSPNPDYPQDIHVVTGEQTVSVTGKNLAPSLNSGYAISRNGGAGSTYSVDGNSVTVSTQRQGWGIYLARTQAANLSRCPYLFQDGYVVSVTLSATTSGQLMMGSEGGLIEVGVGTEPVRASFVTYANRNIVFYQKSEGTLEYTISDIQCESGASATAYEVYQSQPYTINLGTTELCKLGNYQDYIYKSGSDWYVHKEVNKHTFTGSENWYLQTSGTPSVLYCGSGVLSDAVNSAVKTSIYSDHFYFTTGSGTGGCYLYNRSVFVFYGDTTTTAATFKTWLGNNNTAVYYPLATPTDTKITDSTLISQLDAIHQFLTRYGYNATVSGNLPLIIDKTNL